MTTWFSEEELEELSDDDILEVIQGDVDELLDKAQWTLVRDGLDRAADEDDDS